MLLGVSLVCCSAWVLGSGAQASGGVGRGSGVSRIGGLGFGRRMVRVQGSDKIATAAATMTRTTTAAVLLTVVKYDRP